MYLIFFNFMSPCQIKKSVSIHHGQTHLEQ
nr:MAG TPA: hypothetical protein [Caudoviricetes sp.]